MDKKRMSQNNPNHQQSSDHRYLERLQFNPDLRKMWLNFFVTNFRVVILLIILISAWGVYSFLRLPRESNPEVKIPFAVVTTAYPGASPADVEELVTKKIEKNISTVKGIKKITSDSSNSFSLISVEFDTSENQEEAIRRLRDEVETIGDLPDDAEDPVVAEVSFDDTPIYTVSITGPYDGFTLRNYADKIKEELEKIPGVREARVSGGDEREMEIAYDPQKITFYGISVAQANQAVSAANVAIAAGNFEGKEFNYPVRADGKFYDEDKLANLPILHTEEGAVIYLKDVADIKEQSIKKTVLSRFSIEGSVPQESVTIDIVKRTGASIIETVDQAKETIDQQVKTYPAGIKHDNTVDFAKFIRRDFDQLTHDFFLTLALVFGILFLIVGLKEAIVAGLAIPLVFFVTFGIMDLTGITLNFLSIFSLLLALGLLVDDAIVVVSATKQYLKTGKFTPEEAVLLVLNDFKVVLTTTTLATTWAFLPLLMASGIIGEFIKSIPITVSVTLISSLFIALMINHPLAAVLERVRLTNGLFFFNIFLLLAVGVVSFLFLGNVIGYIIVAAVIASVLALGFWFWKKGNQKLRENARLSEAEWGSDDLIKEKLKRQGSGENSSFFSRLMHGIIHFDKVIPIYEKYLRMVTSSTKRRVALLVFTLIVFIGAVALPVVGIVPTEFFPASDEENLYINIEAPVGMNLEETNKIAARVEDKLLKHSEIINFSTLVGKHGSTDGSFTPDATHFATITVTLSEKEKREIASYDFANIIRDDLTDIRDAVVKVESPSGGPPSGAAFEARIVGDDLQSLDKIAKELKPILSSIPGVVDADTSLKVAPAEYTFTLDRVRMELYGLNAVSVGSIIRTAISGSEVTTIIRENKEIKVNATFAQDKIPTLEALQNIQIANVSNQPVYVKDVAKVELRPSVDAITRIDQKRVVLLSAGVEGKTRPNEVLAEFQRKVNEEYVLPEGYVIVYGGENEQNTESVLSIIRAMVIAAILIISTMVIQFNSFKKAVIVLVTLPLALIGVFYGMALAGVTLSFPGLIGILALFGIVVKNAIILIDKINLNIKSDIPFYEAIIDAGKSRIEAIFITSICTIFGIIPVTLSNETWMALGSVVIFGLMLSSFLTLFVVPAMYMTFISSKERL